MKNVIENKKILLGIMTMALVFAIIVVSSFWPFILDPSKIGTTEFITEQMIIVAITIFATVSMMYVSQASNAQNPRSEIAKAKVAFEISIKKILEHTVFYQWVKRVLQQNDKKDVAEKGMLKLGVDFKVWGLSDSEIRSLTVAQKFGDTFYKPLTKKQIRGVFGLKKKVNSMKFVSPNYYTSCRSFMQNKNLSEIAASENSKKIFTVVFQLLVKILFSLIGAMIFTSLVRDIAQDGGSSASSWMRFISRMFDYVTSSFLGYMIGCKINDLDAFYITKRIEAHTLFLEDKDFKPIDEAKEAFKQRCLEEEHRLIGRKGDNQDGKD